MLISNLVAFRTGSSIYIRWSPFCSGVTDKSDLASVPYKPFPGKYVGNSFTWKCSPDKTSRTGLANRGSYEDEYFNLSLIPVMPSSRISQLDEKATQNSAIVKKVSAAALINDPLEGHAVKARGKAIYFIEHGKKRFIPDWDTFLAMKIPTWIDNVNQDMLDKYPEGEHMPQIPG